MKNLLMIAIAFVTISTSAQETKKEVQKGDMKNRTEMYKDMTPEEMTKLQTKKLTLKLDLNEKQQAEVEKVLLEEAKTRKTKMEAYKVKGEQAEVEKPSKEQHLKMTNERLDHQIEMKKKMKVILNAEQYEKYNQMQSHRRGIRSKKS